MIREGSLEEMSDGKLYGLNDMVKADCGGCTGCSSCCGGMGDTIILDPYDVYRLTTGLELSFDDLMADRVELQVVSGVILPNMKMSGESRCCSFLNGEGRCSIHAFRPGVCRLFPLGRYYENRGFRYFLQVHECPKASKTKIKVQKWIDTPQLKKYEPYIVSWHYFLNDLRDILKEKKDESIERSVSIYVLSYFYRKAYDGTRDFYEQFYERMEDAQAFKASLK